jgi:ATP-dependent DNA helicase RecG
MEPSLEKLYKYFKLEAERGYDNRAVVGGLARMLEPWQAEARSDGLDDELIQAVVTRLRDYHGLSPTSRAETLSGLLKRIQKYSNKELPILEYSQEKKEEITTFEPTKPSVEPVTQDTTFPQPPKTPEKEWESTQEEPPAALDAPVTVLPGVGPRHQQTLSKLGLSTLGDLLYYYPRRYDDYSKLKPINQLWYGEEVTVIGTVDNISTRSIRSGKSSLIEGIISDGTGTIRTTWFNQPWIAKRLRPGIHIVLSGKVDQYLGRLVMTSPEWEILEQQTLHTNRIVPIYPLTAKITQRWLRRMMHQVVTYWAPKVQDPLPESVRKSANLVDLTTALLHIHFPDTNKLLNSARERLAFDEIFLLQLGVLRQKHSWKERTGRVFKTPDEWLNFQVDRLPYRLTQAQVKALNDVSTDLASGHPMNRLLEGDVGSGKTVIAGLGIAMINRLGAQAALLAPTSILAEQHYKSMLKLLASDEGPLKSDQIRLMIGATPETEKSIIREQLENGDIKLIIGTHALLEAPVIFSDLQFAIIDEQHRFGVEQRSTLRAKGENPHLLVMTATPIPRSLALTIYGDLDLTIIDEMPPGRQSIDTQIFYPRERERAYVFIDNQLEQGHQAFIIYPLVEESEKSQAKAAVDEYDRLQRDVFPNYQVGLLHGRMKADEKEATMAKFQNGEYNVLVSTSVVEVGIDIPNASVMLIEGANRFGLAQLHQFRGRVGRGIAKSYCILIPETSDAAENERLTAMVKTNDGFILAESDLEHRGPGEFLGTRQSGFSELRMASLTDIFLIEKARREAQTLFKDDPNLQKPEHKLISTTLNRFWMDGQGDIS